MKIITCLVFISLLPANTMFALQLKINQSEDSIQIILLNTCGTKKYIYKELSCGPEGSDSPVYLIIKNEADVRFEDASEMKISNYSVPEVFGYIQPNESIIITVKIRDIVKGFKLKSGSYTMQAIYRNYRTAPNVFIGTITSNEINIKCSNQ